QVIYYQSDQLDLRKEYATSEKRISLDEAEEILQERNIAFEQIFKVQYERHTLELKSEEFETYIKKEKVEIIMTNEMVNFNEETGEIIENKEMIVQETEDFTIVKTEDGKFKKNMKYKKFFSRVPETEEDQIELYKVFNDSDSGLVTPLKNM